MPIRTPDGYLDITNATLRGSEIITTSKVGIANSAPTHTLSVGNKLFVDDSAANVLTVSGNLVATSLKIGQIDLTPSYGLEHVANVINTVSNVVQFTNTTTGFVSVSNVGIGTSTSPAGLLDVVGAFRMRYQDMGVTKAHIITGANSTSLNEDAGTYTYTRGAATTTGNFLPNPSNIVPKVGQRYRVKLTARSDYAGTIRYECPTSTIITTYDLTTSFKEYTWDFNAEGTTMQFAVTTPLGSTTQFNAFSIERLGVGFNVNPTSTAAPVQISGVTHFSDNVGIGTDSPSVPLTVYGSDPADTFGSQVRIVSTSTTGAENSGGVLIFQGHDGVTGRGFASVGGLKENGTSGNHASYLRFSTRASGGGSIAERMRITSTGNVGIGSATPVVKLDVSGIGRFTNDGGSLQLVGTDHTYLEYYPDGVSAGRKGYLGYASAADDNFTIHNDAGSGHILLGSGNVSIGTASPRWGFEVTPTNGLGGILSCSDSPIFSHNLYYSGGWKYGTASTGGAYMRMVDSQVQFWNAPNSGSGTWDTAGGAATATQRMTIDESGNVGIGVASPAAKFDVRGASHDPSTPTVHIGDNTADVGDYGMVNLVRDATSGGSKAHLAFIRYGNTVSAMGFHNNTNNFGIWTSFGGVTSTPAISIDPAGNVGIGTASPVGKLDVWDGASNGTNVQQNAFFYLRNPANAATNYGAAIVFENTDGAAGTRKALGRIAALRENNAANYSSYLQFSPTVAGTEFEAMRITSAGNVGIGTNNPNVRLHVDSGDIGFEYGQGLKVATSGGSMSAWSSGTHNLLFTNWSSNTGAGDVVKFYTPGSQSSTVRMILTSAGNVGINTETMIDSRNYGGIHLPNSKGISFAADSSQSNSRHWRIRTDDYSDWGSLQIGVSGTNSTPPDAPGEAVMTMTRDRNVGIGYAYPTRSLHIKRGTSYPSSGSAVEILQRLGTNNYIYEGQHRAQLRINNQQGTYSNRSLEFALCDNGTGVIQANAGSEGYFPLCLNPGAGNVAIRHMSPSYPLHVAGSAGNMPSMKYFNSGTTNIASGSGDSITIYAAGNIYASGLVAASDERIKKEIVDADDAECLETLRLLKPKRYRYRDEINRGQEPVWGFIAQEVRETLPYATRLSRQAIPNIYELANVSSSNVITFTNFNTSDLEANATTIQVQTAADMEESVTIAEIIDEHAIRVEEDLSNWTGSVDETGNVVTGNQLFVYGQKMDDFVLLKKDAIWTVATAALQEVDRQLQAEKTKTTALETKLQEAEAKIATLQAEKEAIRSDLSSLVLRVTALES